MKWMVALLLFCLPAAAQFSADDQMRPLVYTNETGETFPYRLSAPQFPEAGRRYPLVLFLHGSGECGTDNRRQITVGLPTLLRTLLKRAEPVVVLAPQCQVDNWWVKRLAMGSSYAAAKEPTPSLELALELCRHVAREHQVDPDRFYITGLSLGGFGTWDAIQREPGLFAAALPICGGGDLRRVQGIRQLPIWVFHGRNDKNVPVQCGREIVEALRQSGGRVKYTEFENGEHAVWDRVYSDDKVIDWLLAQRRGAKEPWWRLW